MAIVAAAVNVAPPINANQKTMWMVRGQTTDASGREELRAAPAAGLQLYVTRFRITCTTALAAWLCDEDGTLITSKFYFSAVGGNVVEVDCSQAPRLLVAAKALSVETDVGGDISVEVEGFTA